MYGCWYLLCIEVAPYIACDAAVAHWATKRLFATDLNVRPSMQSMSQSVVVLCRVFLDELKVMALLRTFQQYFFMAAGDWAENLTDALCAHIAQHGTLHEHSVQSMVDSSLKGTSVELDSNAANLKAALKGPCSQMATASRASPQQMAVAIRASQTSGATPSSSADPHSAQAAATAAAGQAVQQLPGSCQASVTTDSTQLKALDAVQLSIEVQWPLSLIVTQVQLRKGNFGIMHTMSIGSYMASVLLKIVSRSLRVPSSAELVAACTQIDTATAGSFAATCAQIYAAHTASS